MAAPITDEKCHVLQNRKYFWCVKNVVGYHPGPVKSNAAVGASLGANWACWDDCLFVFLLNLSSFVIFIIFQLLSMFLYLCFTSINSKFVSPSIFQHITICISLFLASLCFSIILNIYSICTFDLLHSLQTFYVNHSFEIWSFS